MMNTGIRTITLLTVMILALAIVGTASGNGNETLFILGTDVNEAALKSASLNGTITPELNVTIFTKNDTVPDSLNFSNYRAIFIESQNEAMLGMWDANITAAKENGSAVIGYNLSAANATVPNVDLKSANYTEIERYWIQGGEENMEHFLMTIGKNFCDRWAGVDLLEPTVMHPKVNITYIINNDPNRYYLNKIIDERDVITDRFNINVMSGADAVNANLTDLLDQDVVMMYMIGANELPQFRGALLAAKNNGMQIGMFGMNDAYGIATIDMENPPHSTITDYHYNGGYANMENWIRYIGAEFEGVYIEYAPPEAPEVPPHGIYHPEAFPRIFENSTEYLEWYADQDPGYDASAPTIGIIGGKLANEPIFYQTEDAIIAELESEGCNVIYATYKACSDDVDYFTKDGVVLVDALISLKGFYLNYGDQEEGVEYLKKYNVPVLKGVTDYYSTPAEFNNSTRGLDLMSIAFQVTQPEIDGCIDYIWVAGRVTDPDDPTLKYNEPLMPQVEWLCDRTIEWAELGRTNNSDKKIAILYYNHEGGKNNIGASYLDISPSFTLLLEEMSEKDYDIGSGEVPNGSEFINLFIESRNVGSWAPGALREVVASGNVTLVPADEYLSWYNNTLPDSVRADVEAMWGEPPGEIMLYNGSFVIPTVTFGNVVFVPQPTRGGLSSEAAIYHDKTMPPTHQYLAAYYWINNVFDADAMIHFGTHGTQEWLPGNEVGLWRYDYPAIMVDDTPVVYPYIMDNVGEGTQAKRRGNAVIIDHLTPPIVAAGIYDELATLHEKIHDYEGANETTKELYRDTIIGLYDSLTLEDDLDVTVDQMNNMTRQEFETFIKTDVHDYLHELQSTLMPLGLHIFGTAPEDEKRVCMVRSMLRNDFTDHIVDVIPHDTGDLHDWGDAADRYANDLLNETLLNGTDVATAQIDVLNLTVPDPDITADLNRALNYSALLGETTREIDQTLRALNSEYIEPGPGNDPIRNPEALPTGRNFYSFDQRKFPDVETEAMGVILADQLLEQYKETHNGTYPNKVSFILWSVETMRHRGVVEAQIHSLLGVKPTRSYGRITGFEVISQENMTHPRIDVLFLPSGLYRDTFPYQLELMDKAVRMVAELDESNETNYVRYNSLRMYDALIAAGYNDTEALYISRSRIFSEAPGTYGTGLPGAVTASETWENESDLADLFISRLSNIYGQDVWGENYEDVFKLNLADVDAAVHSDSSNLYGMIDNDDFYQYLGGLLLTVRVLTGETPDAYVANLEDVNNLHMTTLEAAFRKELRSRYWNEKWIRAMMEHDYGGAREIMKFVEYMWGWDVTTPEMVTDADWNRIYDVYINDKYEIGADDFLKSENPAAYQSMTARMLEAARKGYWTPSDPDTLKTLVSEYVDSVLKCGELACCHHTCGNLLLDDVYISGLISTYMTEEDYERYQEILSATIEPTEQDVTQPPQSIPTPEDQTDSPSRRDSTYPPGWFNETEQPKKQAKSSSDLNETTKEGGIGKDVTTPVNPSEASNPSENYVEGSEMTVEKSEKFNTGLSFSGAPMLGMILVIALMVIIYWGYRRR
ncbi:MAG: cobaltochelatase subunit CobN, partial [Euryarchaeota archaeon]|nr:cobaltochelatase subunit CobN [Euryarchaeota archaeon]